MTGVTMNVNDAIPPTQRARMRLYNENHEIFISTSYPE